MVLQNPSGCCPDNSQQCCGGIQYPLKAIVSGSGSATVNLTYGTPPPPNPGVTGWAGTFTLCGHAVDLYFWCQTSGPIDSWIVYPVFPDGCVTIPSYGTNSSNVNCEPFEAIMPDRTHIADSCGSCGPFIDINITVMKA